MPRSAQAILLLMAVLEGCSSARILSLIPFPGKSHYINIRPIMLELAARGHDMTVVTTQHEKNPPPNYHQIILDNQTFWDSFGKNHDKFSFANMPFHKEMPLLWNAAYFTTEVAFNSTSLQDFIKNDNSHFDLIFIELFFQEAFYMFAHKYNAPIVSISTMGFTQYLGCSMGNPVELAYMPHEFLLTKGSMGLWKRLENLFYTTYDLLGRKYYLIPKHERLVKKHFKNLPEPIPSLEELEKTVSVVLLNTHYTMDVVRPHIPGIVEIGGVHIKPPKELPEDLQKFLDESEHGVVYFSLGSNLKSTDMPPAKVAMFLKVFSRLKQRVLWKWEDDTLKDKPGNVMIRKWLPQTDILNHPNVRVFITHGGLLSFIEGIHFGKPLIGIPVYGDQHLNTAKAENIGMGLKMAFSGLTEASISNALDKILHNNKYSNVAKELSKRFRDRPNSPMETAVYWIEYVIKHKGANFMRSPVHGMEWFQSNMLDAIAVLIASFLAAVLVICVIFKFAKKQLLKSNKILDSKKSD